MFQLSPVSLKPEIRASKDHHPTLEKALVGLIREVAAETEVVQINVQNAKKLLNAIDAFMAYGLYSSDRCYWPFVREFVPKTEARFLKVEWQCSSDRALSLAWLKEALNRGSFHFQLSAFRQNKKLIARFYHPNACLRNLPMFDRVIIECERLTPVMFSFSSPSSASHDFVPAAVVVNSPTLLPTTRVLRIQRKSRAKLDSETEPPPAAAPQNEHVLTSTNDQDYMLNKLLALDKLGSRIDEAAPHSSRDSIEDKKPQENMETIIRNKSYIFGSLNAAPCGSYDSLFDTGKKLFVVEPAPETAPEVVRVDGEIQLPSSETYTLATSIFVFAEVYQKSYQVFENFVVGKPKERLLVITDKTIYLLSQTLAEPEISLNGVAEVSTNTKIEYHQHCMASMDDIDYINLSDDAQCILLFAKDGTQFKMRDAEYLQGKVVSIAAGDKNLGEAIADAIVKAAEKGRREGGALTVLSETTPYSLIMRRFLTKELKTQPTVQATSLCFWRETNAAAIAEKCHEGYLTHRNIIPSWFGKPSGEWKQSYFVLQGRKLYIYSDMSCKAGERVLDLSGGSVETREIEIKKGHSFTLQIMFPNRPEELPLELQFTTRDEMANWNHHLSIALSAHGPDNETLSCAFFVTDSSLVICQEGEKFLHDEFIRSLLVISIEDIRKGYKIKSDFHACLILEANRMREWLFLRTNAELERICNILSPYIETVDVDDLEENLRQLLTNQSRRVSDHWHRPVPGSEHFEDGF